QMRGIQRARVIGALLRAHVEGFLVRSFGAAMAKRTAVGLGDRLAELVHRTREQSLATFLRCRQLVTGQPPAVRPRRQAANVNGQVGKRKVVVVFRSPEVFLRPRSSLGGDIGIAAVPLERLGVFDALNEPVVYNVAAKSIRLQVPGQSIERRIDVAGGATDLALKRVVRGIKGLLAMAQLGACLRPGKRNGRGHVICSSVDYADGVLKPVG